MLRNCTQQMKTQSNWLTVCAVCKIEKKCLVYSMSSGYKHKIEKEIDISKIVHINRLIGRVNKLINKCKEN